MAKYDAFVSYSHADEKLVRPIVQFLSIGGRQVYWYQATINPGERWSSNAIDALQNSDTVMVLWCCHSAVSASVGREVEAASLTPKPIVPVLLCSYPIEPPLAEYQWIDYRTSVRHECAHAREEASHELSPVLSLVIAGVGLSSLTPAIVERKWMDVAPPRPVTQGVVTFFDKFANRMNAPVRDRGVSGYVDVFVILLIALLIYAYARPAAIAGALLVSLVTVLMLFEAITVWFRRRPLRSAEYHSQLLGLTLESIIRLSRSGQLETLLKRP
jgi:hypothetical protein